MFCISAIPDINVGATLNFICVTSITYLLKLLLIFTYVNSALSLRRLSSTNPTRIAPPHGGKNAPSYDLSEVLICVQLAQSHDQKNLKSRPFTASSFSETGFFQGIFDWARICLSPFFSWKRVI